MKKLKRMVLRSRLVAPIVGFLLILVFGASIAYFCVGFDSLKYIFGAKDISKIDCSELEDDQFVKFNAENIISWFVSYDNGYTYVMEYENDEGDTRYIGLFVNSDSFDITEDELRDMAREGRLKDRGIAMEMTSLEKQYLDDFFMYCDTEEFDEDALNNLPNGYIIYSPFTKAMNFDWILGLVLIAGSVIIAFIVLIEGIWKAYRTDIGKILEEKNIDPDDFATDIENSYEYASLKLGRRYALKLTGTDLLVLEYAKIVKIRSEQRTVAVKGGTSYQYRVIFELNDGSAPSTMVDSALAAKNLKEKIHKLAPQIEIVD